MTTREPSDLQELREIAAAEVQAGTLRSVAREIGLSPVGLQKFLAGSSPYAKTRKRLFEWWSREHRHLLPELSSPAVSQEVEAVIGAVPPEQRAAVRDDLIATLRRLYEALPDRCPEWVGELAQAPHAPSPASH
jgi:hypothetical protein